MASFAVLGALALLAQPVHPAPLNARQAASNFAAIPASAWTALGTQVGGRLQPGYPMGRPCFTLASPGTQGSLDPVACLAVQQNYTSELGIVEYFGGYLTAQWPTCQKTNQECALDFQAPQNPAAYAPPRVCYQGSVSPYYINASASSSAGLAQPAADAAAAFAFVKQYKIPLNIKNSGHDYKGRSAAPNSLGFWTHKISYVSLNNKFVAAGCAASTAGVGVTYGAGVGFNTLYEFAEQNSITILGGSSRTVGAAGGWLAGGGHGALSNTLGMGVDRALEIKVVIPNGQFLTTSRCQNKELFYALRGGGGSTFGIVMEVTSLAAPKLTLQVAYIRFLSVNLDSVRQFLQIIIANQQKWSNEGWGGYIEPAAISTQSSGLVLMTPKLTNDQAKASFKPLTDYVASLGNVALNNEVDQVTSFYQAYQNYILPNAEMVDVAIVLGSRLIPKANFANATSQAALLNATMNAVTTVKSILPSTGLIYAGAPVQILVTTPANAPGDGTSALNPAWRTALWHFLVGPTYNPYIATSADIATAYQQSTDAINFLRALTPPAAYINEAAVHEPNYVTSFYGSNANFLALSALKKYYDPNNLLSCWQCIGWQASDATTKPQYSCYV